jgi:SNF2 family DNA or RNA helicase
VSNIKLDITNLEFRLTGDFDLIAQKRRFLDNFISIGGFRETEDSLVLPFVMDEFGSSRVDQEDKFNKIIKIANKFNVSLIQSAEVINLFNDINAENTAFSEFSKLALRIRNNEHQSQEFDNFISAVDAAFPAWTPYRLQLLSAYHLAFSQNACNFSVPGAGKTTTVYSAYAYLKSLPSGDYKHVNKLLIICPLAAFEAWKTEFKNCFGRDPIFKELVGLTPAERKEYFYSSSDAELSIISYHSATGSEQDLKNISDFIARNKVMLVLDEAHKIKNTDGGRTAEGILKISKHAKSRVVLTGTPAPNGYQDLINLFKFIWPTKKIIKYPAPYLKELSGKYNSTIKEKIDDLVDSISPYFMRVRKSDLGLPPVVDNSPIYVEMDPEQKSIYEKIEEKYIKNLKSSDDSSISFTDVLKKAKMIRLMQCATNPELLLSPLDDFYEDIGAGQVVEDDLINEIQKYKLKIPNKFKSLKSLVSKIITQDGPEGRVVVWSIFIKNMTKLQLYLKSEGIDSELLYGDTPNENENTPEDVVTRAKIIRRFHQDDCPYRVIIANPFAVGESISLHKACRNAIYFEKNFNAAMYMQSKDRIHRYGLKDGEIVNYYHLLSKDTIDEVVHDRVILKEERMLEIIENEDIPLLIENMGDEDDSIDNSDFRAIINAYYKRRNIQP